MIQKYSAFGVKDITPPKTLTSHGVDLHLIVGQGAGAVNVIVDAKYSGQNKPVTIYNISSFVNALKNEGEQLRANIVQARKAGLIDQATARGVYDQAKRGAVLPEVVPVGAAVDVGPKLKGIVSVTAVDTFAFISEKFQSVQVSKALAWGRYTQSLTRAVSKELARTVVPLYDEAKLFFEAGGPQYVAGVAETSLAAVSTLARQALPGVAGRVAALLTPMIAATLSGFTAFFALEGQAGGQGDEPSRR